MRNSKPRTLGEHMADAMDAGPAFSVVRHIPMLLAEIASGMGASEIGQSRALAEVTNRFPTGFCYKEMRDALYGESVKALAYKYLPNCITSNQHFHKNIDRACGVPAAIAEGMLAYHLVYPVILKVPSENILSIPSVASGIVTLLGGGVVGTAIETYRDGRGHKHHHDRSLFANKRWFPVEPSQEDKRNLVNRFDICTTSAVAMLFLSTNAMQIYESIRQLF